MLANARQHAAHAGRCAVVAALMILAGCRSTTVPPPSANASQSQSGNSAATTLPGARRLQIDPERTVVTVFVRRAGPLAKLGHDHVITSTDEAGSVWLGNTPADSSFELALPVDLLDVDLPAARAAAGLEFAAPVADAARAGTLQHAACRGARCGTFSHHHAAIRGDVRCLAATRRACGRDAEGVEREQEIPVVVELDADGLTARGELRLNQTDFGITPFAVAGGAIRVADTLEIRFEIAAASPGAISLPRVP